MRIVIYAGPAPSHAAVIAFAAPILRRAASAVILVTGGGGANDPLLRETLEQLDLPATLPHILRTHEGDAIDALVWEAGLHEADLVVIGRLQPALQRLILGQRGKHLVQQLDVAVLRVQGRIGQVRRILLASGGDAGTITNAAAVARLAGPLGASVTILHVISQQSLVFEGFDRPQRAEEFLAGPRPEAQVLREAAALLSGQGVKTRVIARVGSVVDTVIAGARRYDLLVIGAHRVGSPLDRILLEDLAGDILDLSPIPVLVAKKSE